MKNPIFQETTERLRIVLDEGLRFKSPMADIEKEMTRHILSTREALVMAWVAETGVKPSEAVICHGIRDGHSRMWVESKDENDKRSKAPGFGEEHL